LSHDAASLFHFISIKLAIVLSRQNSILTVSTKPLFKMSTPTNMSSKASDPTFRSYTLAEAKIYAAHRLSYSEDLYNVVLSHHASTDGQFNLLLDVGCGPGNATRDLASSFDEVVGADPGEEMINAARELEGETKSGKKIRFEVCGAEELTKIEGLEGKVDLLTAAMAAHCKSQHRGVNLLSAKLSRTGNYLRV
jgi:2-polyprenyl-3-methyl-5-hydroxy-6-metoxy-1,4-benzoquinol methylase